MEHLFSIAETDRIIEMAWDDRARFKFIGFQFCISVQGVIELMRKNMKRNSFHMWLKRVQCRSNKHFYLRDDKYAVLNVADKV